MEIQANIQPVQAVAPPGNNEMPLAFLLDIAIQRTYHEIMLMADM